jgi:hypothetical protein
MFGEVYPEWDISSFEVHAQAIIDQTGTYYECVKNADVVLSQPIHDGFRGREDLSLNWVKANVRADASVIVFPSMHFAAHQPGWEMNPLPGFDLLAAQLVASGLETDEATQRLLSVDLLTDAEIEREIAVAIDETKRREIEDAIDVKIGPFLEDLGRARLLFHLSNHPMRETAVFVANGILARMGFARRIPVEGHDYQAQIHIPPLPAITRFLARHNGTAPDPEVYDTVRLHGIPAMTVNDYYTGMVGRLALMPKDELFETISGRWPTVQFLRRLAAHKCSIPGIDRWAS